MSSESKIEWTEATWNMIVGCTHVSDGCGTFDAEGSLVAGGCYAAREASGRLSTTPTYAGLASGGRFTGEVRLLPNRLELPLRWRSPRLIFANSMSDLFHEDVPDEYVARVFAVMALAGRHTFQILTKRPGRMRSLVSRPEFRGDVSLAVLAMLGGTDPDVDATRHDARASFLADGLTWPIPNVWLGTSVEDRKWATVRIPPLLATPAAVRFLSCEPLLGALDLGPYLFGECGCLVPGFEGAGQHAPDCAVFSPRRDGLGWVIAGGESGPKARPMHPAWVREIRDACAAAGVPFLFKQWGEWVPGAATSRWRVALDADGGPGIHFPPGEYARPSDAVLLERAGKKAAGRELDGHTHDDMPQRAELVS